MFSIKSRAWQLGLTLALLVLTYTLGLTSFVSAFEFDLFTYIVNLKPVSQHPVDAESFLYAPQWSLLLVYGCITTAYVRWFTRSRTTALSLLLVFLLFFALLMLEVTLAVFLHFYLPVIFPAAVMMLLSLGYWGMDFYRQLTTQTLFRDESISLSEIEQKIADGELQSALILLKQSPYSDELLEIGYELGMLLESGKHWASALNLYHWLSAYDPGLSDFVTRIEDIRKNRDRVLSLGKVMPQPREDEAPMIGHFRLQKKIAMGSTAVVYQAIDLRTHNSVALKVMVSKSREKNERDRIKQWLDEAEIVARLDHRNIVKIHDAGMHGDSAYIAMDHIFGYSMSLRLRKREYLTVGECLRISKAMLRALIAAHSHGIVHGDIKPANIMYDERNDSYILTDFGAAYTEQNDRHSGNKIVGTPAYMSPEQLGRGKIDGRSDLFSLAVTLYHLVNGVQPFAGNSLPELKRSILDDQPVLNHSSMPGALIEVILKALQKKPYMRFADAQQMLTAIECCEAILREKMEQHN
ncbi:MAG: tRNA A-37 threonylcarbamoyl transferase component Bud32 [Planctomycetota bacterium]|jgi:tRNA A-37 threonylcarbamoyl transferase component Bud32